SFFEGMKLANTNHFLNEVSAAIQKHVEDNGMSVVVDFVGHGIGQDLHEAPEIPNFRQMRKGPKLQAGMTLAIEPMVNLGGRDVVILDDGWTVKTADGKLTAHYENTVLITPDGNEPEILTL
ncbi:MAG: M24 family metallopeptidase, partial [Defluviitaleaceae bacterium]|nr:M24 family metallopeptidase [Defluviitaleaceae bacterium]